MSSLVEIYNQALDLCRALPVTNPNDQSQSARLCNRNFDQIRDAVLRAYPWNCAMKRASLPAMAEAPAFGYVRQFGLPADCLRIYELYGYPEIEVVYQVEGRALLTDELAPLLVRYIARIEDPALFDPMLVEVIAARLAVRIAPRLLSSTSDEQRLMQHAAEIERRAKHTDAMEGTPGKIVANDWLEARA